MKRLNLESFMDLLKTVLVPGAQSIHHVHAPEVELVDAANAHGIWAMDDYVTSGFGSFRGYGHYIEAYRKIDGIWKIASWRLKRLRIDA